MKKLNQKGITLIALVVTIIVLIILAGISINLLFGDNGIIKKAQDAGSEFKKSSNEEEIGLADLDRQIDNYLNGINGGSGNNNPVTTEDLGKYGRKVLNYTAQDLVWRFFHEDDNNIYLISETQDGEYPIESVDVLNYDSETRIYSAKDPSYVSGESVSQEGRALNSLAAGATSNALGTNPEGTNLFTSSNTNESILAVAYLCDTSDDGPWAAYKQEPAAWAMGGPTIELFAASYNTTHQGGNQVTLVIEDGGYTSSNMYGDGSHGRVGWFTKNEFHGIYRLKDEEDTYNMWWVASPGYSGWLECAMAIIDGSLQGIGCEYQEGWISDMNTMWNLSSRPVVCIPKSSGFVCEFANEL